MKLINKIYPLLITASLVVGFSIDHHLQQSINSSSTYAQTQQVTTEKPLIVIAYLEVKPEYRQRFLDLANIVQTKTNETEEGVNSYVFYEDKNTPNLFFFFEDWKNEQAFEEHLQKSYTKNLTETYGDILKQPADVRIYRINDIEQKQVP